MKTQKTTNFNAINKIFRDSNILCARSIDYLTVPSYNWE